MRAGLRQLAARLGVRPAGPIDVYVLPTEAATFDGRDVFAPAAAHLCHGGLFADEMGKIGQHVCQHGGVEWCGGCDRHD